MNTLKWNRNLTYNTEWIFWNETVWYLLYCVNGLKWKVTYLLYCVKTSKWNSNLIIILCEGIEMKQELTNYIVGKIWNETVTYTLYCGKALNWKVTYTLYCENAFNTDLYECPEMKNQRTFCTVLNSWNKGISYILCCVDVLKWNNNLCFVLFDVVKWNNYLRIVLFCPMNFALKFFLPGEMITL